MPPEIFKYTIAALFFVGAWCLLFALAPKSRKAILWSSLAWGHVGPITEYWHHKDYWNPTYLVTFKIGGWMFGFEDYLFAFTFLGLCAGIFDVLARWAGEKELRRFNPFRFLNLSLLVLCSVFGMGLLTALFHINSLHAITLVFLAGASLILARRHNWITSALLSALIIGALMWFGYWIFIFRLFPEILAQWWNHEALSGICLGGVPIEEFIWAFVTGLFVGPLLRYCMQPAAGR